MWVLRHMFQQSTMFYLTQRTCNILCSCISPTALSGKFLVSRTLNVAHIVCLGQKISKVDEIQISAVHWKELFCMMTDTFCSHFHVFASVLQLMITHQSICHVIDQLINTVSVWLWKMWAVQYQGQILWKLFRLLSTSLQSSSSFLSDLSEFKLLHVSVFICHFWQVWHFKSVSQVFWGLEKNVLKIHYYHRKQDEKSSSTSFKSLLQLQS